MGIFRRSRDLGARGCVGLGDVGIRIYSVFFFFREDGLEEGLGEMRESNVCRMLVLNERESLHVCEVFGIDQSIISYERLASGLDSLLPVGCQR